MSRQNNFDIIRLLAALQVAFFHAKGHLKVAESPVEGFIDFFKNFPGVPIFFTVSGFLIYQSYARNSQNLRQYVVNRALRIYPGLWVCLAATVLLLFVFRIIDLSALVRLPFGLWLLAQLTFFQFFTPDLLRVWGVGTPNGALWTVSVELQFYALVPLVFWLLDRPFGAARPNKWLVVAALFGLSVLSYAFLNTQPPDSLLAKLGAIAVLPYLYCFLVGIVFAVWWPALRPFIEGKFWGWLVGYVAFCLVFSNGLGLYKAHYWPNAYGLVANVLLGVVTLSGAYSATSVSQKLLRGFDVSYGVYIYQMLIINTYVATGRVGSYQFLFEVIALSAVCGALSWHFVERKALGAKQLLMGKQRRSS